MCQKTILVAGDTAVNKRENSCPQVLIFWRERTGEREGQKSKSVL